MTQAVAPYTTDAPESDEIVWRVYPPVASAKVSFGGGTTRVVPANPSSVFGPNFVGPLPATATQTVTTGNKLQITQGSFASTPIEFRNTLSYSFQEHYLTPTAAWEFSLDLDELSPASRATLVTGAKVELVIDGNIQAIGYTDDIRIRTSRSSGSIVTVSGRDWISPAVDSHVDPQTRFSAGQTLEQLLQQVFAIYGMQVLATDNLANLNVITGAKWGSPTSKKGKPLKSYKLHQTEPYNREGAYAFALRVASRFGLWLRPAADGKTIVCGAPDFDQSSRYTIRLKNDGTNLNNVLDAEVAFSREEQPSIIFAFGTGGGGEWPRSSLKGAVLNPLAILADDEIIGTLLKAYPGLVAQIPPMPALINAAGSLMYEPFARPQYLYDSESHDPAELSTFLQREISLRMRKSLTAKYTVIGHRLGGQPIAVDTIVDVDDDVSGIHSTMWVMSRTMHKQSRESGARTEISCIRPGTLVLGPGTNS